ncbi:MAG: oligopeptide transporter, OPT family [Gemmatimonadota bacterium]|nr:MAG: oligopeptide transporter, OPT family [Gemmatimonadota bacterium]
MEERKQATLPENAYTPLKEGEEYLPYIPPTQSPPEITTRSIFWGVLMAAIFTAAAAYLGLKIGQVFEAAIPIAILAVGLAGMYARRSTILENVIIQSIGGASGVIVAGAIFTIPALYILELNANFFQIFLASLFGGFLGILFLVPLRKYFCADQHGLLPFPEATAITEVLVTGEAGGEQAKVLIWASLLGGLYDFCIASFHLWSEIVSTRVLPWGAALADRAKLIIRVNAGAAVMGLGYIIGLRYAAIICAGSFVSWLVIIPAIWYFGQHLTGITIIPGDVPIAGMSPEDIFYNYVRHIGIGGIACAGVIGIIKNIKIIVGAFSLGFKEIFSGKITSAETEVRTQKDIPMSALILIIGLSLICILLFFRGFVVDGWGFALVALLLAMIIGFLFTTVAARATAIVGVNPVSGMTLMTLILSSVILVKLGLSGPGGMVSALIIGTVVCTALSMSGGFITDLKTGYWLGSTPQNQERFKFLGTLVAALCVGGVVLLLNKTNGFVPGPEHPNPLAAPQANAMAAILRVLFGAQAPWGLYVAGIFMALVMEILKISPLAFALGMYLPIELNTPLLIGGIVAHVVSTRSKDEALNKARREKGTLIASGFIAGGALMGVISAVLTLVFAERLHTGIAERGIGEWISIIFFIGLCLFMYYWAKGAKKDTGI